MRGTLTIAHLTFQEARRRRILAAALLLGSAFLALFGTGLHFIQADLARNTAMRAAQKQIALNFVVMAGLYAANFLIVMTSVLTPIETLAGEISSGTIQTVATKPVRRAAVVLGKWLGCWLLVTLYVTLLCGGVLVVSRVVARFTPPHAAIGIPLMLLEATLLMTLSIAGGTRLSALANGITAFGLYGVAFIGGWMEHVGTMMSNATARYIGIAASLLVPSESLWQLAAYHMQASLMRDVNLTPFSPASVPSPTMVVWAGLYTVSVLALALLLFQRRSL